MKLIGSLAALTLAATVAMAQGTPDCTIGHFAIGGPQPKITSSEYESSISVWFQVRGAEHYKTRVAPGGTPFKQFIAVKDGRILALSREFTTDRTQDVIDALHKRYGQPEIPHAKWLKWSGFASERGHLTWFDRACGLRVDAFQSIDPSDKDERSVVVWTAGVNGPATPADDAVR